ncbi:MAG: pilus assembly PilX N-terminal domain-containing protein [Candidatus Acidiferrales bacterium]
MRVEREKGIALITALLVLFLVSAMVIGMCWMVMTDQRLGGNNKDRETAFYGAEAGMEKLTADMGSAFTTNGKLTAPQVAAIVANPPTTATLPNIQFLNASGGSTYQVAFTPNGTNGDPLATNATILPPSPYAGMQGLITQFTLNVAAQTISTGAEVKLQRQMQVVSIPVFQFGVYSDSDLAFFNGPNMTFGGRTHTNGNLWLTPSGQLNMGNKVTVVGQVLRQYLENGDYYTTGSYSGATYIATTPNPTTTPPAAGWRALAQTEGSVTGFSEYGDVSTTPNSPTWANAEQAYNGMLQNNVSQLSLTAAALGGITTPISLIRRAVPGELASNPAEFNEQYFSEASIRILLDDYKTVGQPSSGCAQSDMMSLDTVTSTTPVDLTQLAVASNSPYQTSVPSSLSGAAFPSGGTWNAINANNQFIPLPVSGASAAYITPGTTGYNGYWEKAGYPIITGCLKIEVQNNTGGWTDVTAKILSQGYIGRNINPTYNATYVSPELAPLPGSQIGAEGPTTNTYVTGAITCHDPSPNAIIRLARLRDNPVYNTSANPCGNLSSGQAVQATDVWPNVLFDPREGILRPSNPANNYVTASGVMDYVELDMKNLAAWVVLNQSTYNLNNNTTGFTVYFSDRRGEQLDNQGGGNVRTGSYGYNDIVNPSSQASGCPNTTIDQGEDLEGDGNLRTYGGVETPPAPISPTNYMLANLWNTTGTGYMSVAGTVIMHGDSNCSSNPNRPDVGYNDPREARVNPPLFFRRALKIVDGQSLNFGTSCGTVACGITIATENPVYVQGDFNAPPDGSWSGTSVAAAIAGDAFTILSDNWNDVNSFAFPWSTSNPGRVGVQTAIRAAVISGKGIPFPEINNVQDFGTDGGVHNFLRYLEGWGSTLHYMGSLVSFYYNRQGVGTYKSSVVYGAPTRDYNFDTNFTLGPQYLPPNTPTLRSVNTTGFSQQLLPSQ